MSARMLQRALRDQKPIQLPHTSIDELEENIEDDSAEVDDGVAKNPFDLLGIQEDDIDEKEDGAAEPESNVQEAVLGATSPKRTSLSKAKKKNKGKKKSKHLNASEAHVREESIDSLLERLAASNLDMSSSESSRQKVPNKSSSVNDTVPLLAVNSKYLRAEDELRRIFGAKVINAVEKSGDGATARYRRQGVVRHAGRVGPLKRTILVAPMETWPRWDGGISMEYLESKDGLMHFRYVYSTSYMEIQKEYEACVESHDPNTIASLLMHHPYHIDSLLALAEVYKHLGEYQRSASLLEQCLYALENAWHSMFNPSAGNCRLKYSYDQNKPFFFALIRHMQHLGRRGCHRTALEICKLLLSLDSDDPLGALFSIDYYALRAEQYAWLESFVGQYNKDKSIALLPNFSFSIAVARFYLEPHHSTETVTQNGDSKSSIPEGKNEDKISSSELLQQALMLHPLVLKKIILKAPIKEDLVWARLLKHWHFSAASAGGPSLEHLINIYIERHHLVWRVPDLQTWLKTAALAVVETADKPGNDGGEIANWACVRKEAFQSDQNEYRHLILSEFSDSTSTLSPDQLQQIGFQDREVMEGDAAHNLGHAPDMNLEGRNVFMVFLQSFLPWRDYGIDLHGEDPQDRGGRNRLDEDGGDG
ncbi:hypothetical protein O6H91_05G131800 [Diphasiastrum complanatum]|uniref:Uncharacterized protein n=1 Tax=Diphasiastrum complanatum TaxID=34168 RepID=A0ACC2DT84_DIPCM|nr:hypothetical protein O6H91_05G131800 [Diphasiastrum complanatum]